MCNLATQKSACDDSCETTPLLFNLMHPSHSKDYQTQDGTDYSRVFSATDQSSFDARTIATSEQLSKSVIQPEISITNYESALEWGRIGLNLKDPISYQKNIKSPKIYYRTSRPDPIIINEI